MLMPIQEVHTNTFCASERRSPVPQVQEGGLTSACQGYRSHAHPHVAELLVVLALGPPLLQLLLASDGGKVVRLLELVVELHAVLCRPVFQKAGDGMEVLHRKDEDF